MFYKGCLESDFKMTETIFDEFFLNQLFVKTQVNSEKVLEVLSAKSSSYMLLPKHF